MKKIAIIIIIVLVVAAGAFALTREDNPVNTATNTAPSTTTDVTSQETITSTDESTASVITYSNSGFAPASITVRSGDTITIKNSSSSALEFDSDPHPVHTDDRELNIGAVQPGESKTATLTTKGTWGYHNHLNSSETGTIKVQ